MVRKKSKAYLTYEMDDTTRSLLLDEEFANCLRITIGEKVIETTRIIPKALIKDLEQNHCALVEHIKAVKFKGKKKVFNIPYSKSRTMYIDRVAHIRIAIYSTDIIDLMESVSKVKRKMTRYKKTPKICVWDKVGLLHTHIHEPEPIPIKVDFSKPLLIERRAIEMKTERGNYN